MLPAMETRVRTRLVIRPVRFVHDPLCGLSSFAGAASSRPRPKCVPPITMMYRRHKVAYVTRITTAIGRGGGARWKGPQAMRVSLRFIAVIVATTGLMVGTPTTALADDTFGQMVAMCAQMDLGETGNPPTVTCICNGGTMTFANFGGMVQHMKGMTCTSCTGCC